jgi:hypothetical protein
MLICATEHYNMRQINVVGCLSKVRHSRLVYISIIFPVTIDLRVANQIKLQSYKTWKKK